jgi:hypothetical protein
VSIKSARVFCEFTIGGVPMFSLLPRCNSKVKPMPQLSNRTTIQFMIGPNPKGPQRCLRCRQPFKQGEAWQRYTSPPDPIHGSYAIGIHDRCLRK